MADQSVRGRFVWHELMTPDSNAAHAFYSKAVGWKSQPWEEDSSYVMFAAERGPVGATVSASDGEQPHWLPYIGTGDIEATIELAQEKGGSVVKGVETLSAASTRY
jgi:predicted enzyme related to lactoylglutathione lyase